MFSHMNLEQELERVIGIRLPYAFDVSISEENLCRCYLYNLVIKQYGIFNNAPLLHLPHDNLPLVENLWSNAMSTFFNTNRDCIYVLTDGEFQFPEDQPFSWVPRGRKYGPVFADNQLKFHGKRYEYKHAVREIKLFVDVFTASPVGRPQDPNVFDFRFRALKIHKPYTFNYRAQGRNARRRIVMRTGPYGNVPDVFLTAPPPP